MHQVFAGSSVSNDIHGDEIQAFSIRHRLKARVDEDGTKIIPGKFGHVYLYDDDVLGVMVIPDPPRKHYWGHLRTTLLKAGFVVMQDGDGEGAATFDPADPQQAELAIGAVGIKRRRKISPEQREKQIAWLRASAGRVLSATETRCKPTTIQKRLPAPGEASGSVSHGPRESLEPIWNTGGTRGL